MLLRSRAASAMTAITRIIAPTAAAMAIMSTIAEGCPTDCTEGSPLSPAAEPTLLSFDDRTVELIGTAVLLSNTTCVLWTSAVVLTGISAGVVAAFAEFRKTGAGVEVGAEVGIEVGVEVGVNVGVDVGACVGSNVGVAGVAFVPHSSTFVSLQSAPQHPVSSVTTA